MCFSHVYKNIGLSLKVPLFSYSSFSIKALLSYLGASVQVCSRLTKSVVLHWGNFVPKISGNVWQHFGLSQLAGGGGATGNQLGIVRDATKHPTIHVTTCTPPMTKNYPAQNVTSAEVERSCSKLWFLYLWGIWH